MKRSRPRPPYELLDRALAPLIMEYGKETVIARIVALEPSKRGRRISNDPVELAIEIDNMAAEFEEAGHRAPMTDAMRKWLTMSGGNPDDPDAFKKYCASTRRRVREGRAILLRDSAAIMAIPDVIIHGHPRVLPKYMRRIHAKHRRKGNC